MDMLTIEQQILVLSNTIKMIQEQYTADPSDIELKATCIKIRRHLLDHLDKNNLPLLGTCTYCLSDYREDISTPADTKEK
jgi:hypothetical protein